MGFVDGVWFWGIGNIVERKLVIESSLSSSMVLGGLFFLYIRQSTQSSSLREPLLWPASYPGGGLDLASLSIMRYSCMIQFVLTPFGGFPR